MNIEHGPDGIVWAEGSIGHAVTELHGRERAVADAIVREHRLHSFVSGRVAAHAAVGELLAGAETIEILAAPDGAPEAYSGGIRLDVSVSIAHRGSRVIAAAVATPAVIGCDLERIEARSKAFVEDFLTPDESAAVRCSVYPDLMANLAWCAKEAVLKVRRTGLRRDTRSVIASIETLNEEPSEWCSIPVHDTIDPSAVRVWWRVRDGYVYTLAMG